MAKILFTGTHGADDPTRATLPFHMGKGAIDAGHDVSVALIGDATYLMKQPVRDAIVGVALPPVRDLFQFAVEHGVRIYI